MSCLFFHNWTKWESFQWNGYEMHSGLFVKPENTNKPVRCAELRQKRNCKDCGYTQEELISKG